MRSAIQSACGRRNGSHGHGEKRRRPSAESESVSVTEIKIEHALMRRRRILAGSAREKFRIESWGRMRAHRAWDGGAGTLDSGAMASASNTAPTAANPPMAAGAAILSLEAAERSEAPGLVRPARTRRALGAAMRAARNARRGPCDQMKGNPAMPPAEPRRASRAAPGSPRKRPRAPARTTAPARKTPLRCGARPGVFQRNTSMSVRPQTRGERKTRDHRRQPVRPAHASVARLASKMP